MLQYTRTNLASFQGNGEEEVAVAASRLRGLVGQEVQVLAHEEQPLVGLQGEPLRPEQSEHKFKMLKC